MNSKAEDYFFTENGIDSIEFVFDELRDVPTSMADLCSVFSSNLLGAALTAMSFHVFSERSAYRANYQGFLGVELGLHAVGGESNEANARRASEILTKRLAESEWGDRLKESSSQLANASLSEFVSDDIGQDIATRILNQCAVLVWSAFEVLASDLFVRLVNKCPALAGKLLKGDKTKSLYQVKELGSSLEDYNYDLSSHMGEALLEQRKLDSLLTIKAVYETILDSNDDVRSCLNDVGLWKLYKARNVIVHRAGIVDEQFKKDTGSALAVGSSFRVTPEEFNKSLVLIGRTGVVISRGVLQLLP